MKKMKSALVAVLAAFEAFAPLVWRRALKMSSLVATQGIATRRVRGLKTAKI